MRPAHLLLLLGLGLLCQLAPGSAEFNFFGLGKKKEAGDDSKVLQAADEHAPHSDVAVELAQADERLKNASAKRRQALITGLAAEIKRGSAKQPEAAANVEAPAEAHTEAPKRRVPGRRAADQAPTTEAPAGPVGDQRMGTGEPSIVVSADASGLGVPLANLKNTKQAGKEKKSRFSSSYFKDKMKRGLEMTRDGLSVVAETINEMPKKLSDATNSLQAMLKLDNKGRLLSLLEGVQEDIKFVKSEFSTTSMVWTPLFEQALRYLGAEGLNKLKLNKDDELDYRQDALTLMAFGYEFMRLMVAWRENMLAAHQAYRTYLTTIKEKLAAGASINVNEEFIFNLQAVHNYFQFLAWASVDEAILEPKMKLDYLMVLLDDTASEYERVYFRGTIVLQEVYEPTMKELERQREATKEALIAVGAKTSQFGEVEQYYDHFRQQLAAKQLPVMDCELPVQLYDVLNRLEPELRFNQLVYEKDLFKELKEAKENMANEMYGEEGDDDNEDDNDN